MEREWSSELPITPGIYLWKGVRSTTISLVFVQIFLSTGKLTAHQPDAGTRMTVEQKQGIWYGPIPSPPTEKRYREARPRG